MSFTGDVSLAEEQRWAALLAADVDVLDRLLSEDLVYTHANGLFDTKAEYLARIEAGEPKYLVADRSNEQVTVQEQVAVVSGTVSIETDLHGRKFDAKLRYSNVWVSFSGEVRLLCVHACVIPETAPPQP